jgi:uncharacterized protein (TIGR03086 family)
MSQSLRIFTKALYGMDHVVRLVPDKAWTRKSHCPGWTATDILDHALGTSASVLTAVTKGEMPKKAPKSGENKLADYAKLRDQALEALDQPGALAKVANTYFGPMPVDTFMGFMAADLVTHIWDLARTAKVDERLDPALVKHAHSTFKSLPKDLVRQPGMFAAAIKPAAGADAQTKFLNFTGRTV